MTIQHGFEYFLDTIKGYFRKNESNQSISLDIEDGAKRVLNLLNEQGQLTPKMIQTSLKFDDIYFELVMKRVFESKLVEAIGDEIALTLFAMNSLQFFHLH